jgi:hypothetical protein
MTLLRTMPLFRLHMSSQSAVIKLALATLAVAAAGLIMTAPVEAQADPFRDARHWMTQRFHRAAQPSVTRDTVRRVSLSRKLPLRTATIAQHQTPRPARVRPAAQAERAKYVRRARHQVVGTRRSVIVYRTVVQRVYVTPWPFFFVQ